LIAAGWPGAIVNISSTVPPPQPLRQGRHVSAHIKQDDIGAVAGEPPGDDGAEAAGRPQ
jgi:hypothetical protein